MCIGEMPIKMTDGTEYTTIRAFLKRLRKTEPYREFKSIKYRYYGTYWEIKYCNKKWNKNTKNWD